MSKWRRDKYPPEESKELLKHVSQVAQNALTETKEETPAAVAARNFDKRQTDHIEDQKKEELLQKQNEKEDANHFENVPIVVSDTLKIDPNTLAALEEDMLLGAARNKYREWDDDKNCERPDFNLIKSLANKINKRSNSNIGTRMLQSKYFEKYNNGYSMEKINKFCIKRGFSISFGFSIGFMGPTSRRNPPLPTTGSNVVVTGPVDSEFDEDNSNDESADDNETKQDSATKSADNNETQHYATSATSSTTSTTTSPTASATSSTTSPTAEIDWSDVNVVSLWNFISKTHYPNIHAPIGDTTSLLLSTLTGGLKEGCMQVMERMFRDMVDIDALRTHPVMLIIEAHISKTSSSGSARLTTNRSLAGVEPGYFEYVNEQERKILRLADKNVRKAIHRLLYLCKLVAAAKQQDSKFQMTEDMMFEWVLSDKQLPASLRGIAITKVPAVVVGSEAERCRKRDWGEESPVLDFLKNFVHLWCLIDGCRHKASKQEIKMINETFLRLAGCTSICNRDVINKMLQDGTLLKSLQEHSNKAGGSPLLNYVYNSGKPLGASKTPGARQMPWGLLIYEILNYFGPVTLQFCILCIDKFITEGCLGKVPEMDDNVFKLKLVVAIRANERTELVRPVCRQYDDKLNSSLLSVLKYKDHNLSEGILPYQSAAERKCREGVQKIEKNVETYRTKSRKNPKKHVYYWADLMEKEINSVAPGSYVGMEAYGDDVDVFHESASTREASFLYVCLEVGESGSKWGGIKRSRLQHRATLDNCKRALKLWDVKKVIQNSKRVE